MGTVISTHLPPPVMMDRTADLRWVTHMLCWTWAIYFSAAASSEKDQGSMNLASKTAPIPSTTPSRVAAIHGMAECFTRRWTSPTVRPVLRSYQFRLRSSVTLPSCTVRLPERSLRADLSSLLAPEPYESSLVGAHDHPGIGAADECPPIE